MKQHGKNIFLLLAGLLIGSVFVNPVVDAAMEKITGQRSEQEIYVDGQRVEMEAYIIRDNNYVKLRDIGKALDFNVYWDGTVQMNSKAPYTGEAPVNQETTQTGNPGITKEEAVQIALRDVGLGEQDVTSLSVEPDGENGVPVYEVEFRSGSTKYEFDINMNNGDIIDRSQKTEPAAVNTPPVPETKVSREESAVGKALSHAGFTRDEVTRLQIERGYENGREVYEVEFFSGTAEYSYDLDVSSLEIVSWEKDND